LAGEFSPAAVFRFACHLKNRWRAPVHSNWSFRRPGSLRKLLARVPCLEQTPAGELVGVEESPVGACSGAILVRHDTPGSRMWPALGRGLSKDISLSAVGLFRCRGAAASTTTRGWHDRRCLSPIAGEPPGPLYGSIDLLTAILNLTCPSIICQSMYTRYDVRRRACKEGFN